MNINSFKLIIERLVEKNARIGAKLTLGNETTVCIDIKQDKYGKRYIFDNGLGFTKSNIVSTIIKYQLDKEPWRFL